MQNLAFDESNILLLFVCLHSEAEELVDAWRNAGAVLQRVNQYALVVVTLFRRHMNARTTTQYQRVNQHLVILSAAK